MKNTILKMAGVKDEKSFYKKYATEADFLKAHPEAKTQLEKFALGGIDANRQTYAKTIIYSPEEWHQKNILAGNVMLGKKNDLNTMFKNNIYPQYTLPNDTVPINYSPVVKQLPMPQGFVDNSKSTFNYAAGQQLPKKANGGQMNFQTMPQFASGGIWDDITEYAGMAAQFSDPLGIGYGEKAKTALGEAVGEDRKMPGEEFADAMSSGTKGFVRGAIESAPLLGGAVNNLLDTSNEMINPTEYNEDGSVKQLYAGKKRLQKQASGIGEGVAGIAEVALGNPAGASTIAQGFGNFSEGMDTDTSGKRKNSNWAKSANISKTIAPVAGMISGNFTAGMGSKGADPGAITGNYTTPVGPSRFDPNYMNLGINSGFAKYGGQMQYAMGGMNVQPNAEAENDELVTTNTPPQVVSGGEVNMVSNNPYGTPDYAINGNNHGEGENGGGVKMNVASGSVFKGKLKNPLTGNLFKKDFKKISFQENMFTKKLENGDAYAQNTANLILPVLAKTKEDMEMYQQAILDNKKQAKDLRAGIMPGQSQGKMAIGKHGGMMNYMAMGGIQESDYQTDPGKLPSLLRQQKANDATILGMRSSFGRNADTNNVEDPLVVTFNKAKNYGKELADKIKNHPEFKKEMGGKLPMYQDGAVVPASGSSNYFNTPSLNNESINQYKFQQFLNNKERGFSAPQSTFNPYSVESWKFQQQLDKDGALYGNSTELVSDQYTPAQNWNAQGLAGKINPNAGSPSGNVQGNLGVQGPPKIEGKGFDYKKAAGNLGQFALQNAGNIYDLGRSTQDNSKLNLSRMSPTFLDKTQDLQNNLRLYSEGKRQTAEASQGNASTYLSNMYANRASKLANDLNINTTYGNLNASIDNAAKLYNAGAIDKETMFKLQAEGMNRNLKGQALAGMSQNFLNQRNSDRQDALDQERLGLQKQYYKAFYDNQDRENQRRVDEITKGKSNKNSWLDCSSGNCVERTSDQTQSTQSTPFYFSQSQDKWNAMSRQQEAENEMKKLTKGKK